MKLYLKPLLGLGLIIGLFFSCKKNVQNTDEPDVNSSRNGDTIMHKLNIDGNLTFVKQVRDEFYYADDILLSKEQFNSLKRMTLSNAGTIERSTIVQDFLKTWPDAKVYYSYPDATKMTTKEYTDFKRTIDSALTTITDSTNIQFIERTTQPEYIQYVKAAANNSPLGWQKGAVNIVNIFNTTFPGTIMHETIHSLGVAHEQCRPDRDKYIIVNLSAVFPGQEHNFNKTAGYVGYGPFDFNSIMLYDSKAFARNSNVPTITKLDGSTWTMKRMNERELSSGDVNGLKNLYFPVDFNGTYRISSVNSGGNRSLEVSEGSTVDGTSIVLNANGFGTQQQFIFRKADKGSYQIKSVLDTTKVLTVEGIVTVIGAEVELRTNAKTGSQKFYLSNFGNDGFSFIPYNGAQLSLDASRPFLPIIANTANKSSLTQRFYLTKL